MASVIRPPLVCSTDSLELATIVGSESPEAADDTAPVRAVVLPDAVRGLRQDPRVLQLAGGYQVPHARTGTEFLGHRLGRLDQHSVAAPRCAGCHLAMVSARVNLAHA